MSGDRMKQVNELIHHQVAELLLREVELPVDTLVTITRVDTTRDLRYATVYVTAMPDGKRVTIMKSLNRGRSAIQKALGSKIEMKFTPRINFEFDSGEITAQGVYDLFDAPGNELPTPASEEEGE